MSVLDAPLEPEIRYILENARPESRLEMDALNLDPSRLAAHLAKAKGFKYVVYYDKRPAAFIGVVRQHPGVYAGLGFGTPDWINVWKAVTLVARRRILKSVSETGAHRIHCISFSESPDVARWLKFLGAAHMVDLPAYGARGEDAKMFTWLL